MHRPSLVLLAGSAMLLLAGALSAQPGSQLVPLDRALLIVRVPADATLTIGGEATKQMGAERRFTTPTLVGGFTYSYELVATMKDGSTARRTITFLPGQAQIVDLTKPAPEMKGGPEKKTEPEKKPIDKKIDTEKKIDKKGEADKKIDKKIDTEKKIDKKGEADKKIDKKGDDKKVDLPSFEGVVKDVHFDKASFTIGTGDGKTHTFLVNESTKFVGAKGGSRGMGKAALKDETMVSGSAVRVVATPDRSAALEVHLPARKTPAAKDGK
jgi:uncharacterized protein (TIGR03000 family)